MWATLVLVMVAARVTAVPELAPRWRAILLAQSANHLVWLGLAPAIWWLAGAVRTRSIPSQAALMGLVVLTATALAALTTYLLQPGRPIGLIEWWAATGDRAAYLGLAVTAARLAADRFARLRLQAARVGEDEILLRRAELLHLDRQLQPHFLFNSLNAIAELVHVHAATARIAISHLRSLFERLNTPQPPRTSLADELDAIESYLGLQRVRFAERLKVGFDIAPGTAKAWVPTFLLQPLVENAVRHGIECSPSGGTITVSSRIDEAWLTLEVTDRGRPAKHITPRGHGVGLDNVRRRLRCCYGDQASCELVIDDEVGGTATIRIPRGADLSEFAGVDPLPGTTTLDPSPISPQTDGWQHPSWIIARMAAGWLVIGAVWVAWAGLAAATTGASLASLLTVGLVARELGLYLLASLIAVGLALLPERLGWSPRWTVIGQGAACCLALFGVAAVVGLSQTTHQAKLIAWEGAQTRVTGFLMTLIVANAWAWHVRLAQSDSAAAEARAHRIGRDAAFRRWHLQPDLLRRALVQIGAFAESAPERADELVVVLADLLRQGLEAIQADQWSPVKQTALEQAWADLHRRLGATQPGAEQPMAEAVRG